MLSNRFESRPHILRHHMTYTTFKFYCPTTVLQYEDVALYMILRSCFSL